MACKYFGTEKIEALRILYLLRHAKAEPGAPGGDSERPLSKRGRRDAAAMGTVLGKRRPGPELALCSPSARTRQTLERVLPALDPPPRVVYDTALYLADPETLLERLCLLPNETHNVLVVGHNPCLHEFGALLAADPGQLAEGFPTAALAVLQAAGAWSALRWHRAALIYYRTPKEVSHESG